MPLPEALSALEQAARERGLSPKALCERIGISRATWQRWKAGTNTPSYEAWLRLRDVAREFGVDA